MKTKQDKSYEALRKLLLHEDEIKLSQLERELNQLKIQIADKEALIASLDPILAELLERKIINSRDEMAEALAPIMSEAIKRQIADAKDDVVDALYPIIGKTIRKSVAEAMKNLVETVNKKIDQTLRGKLFTRKVKSKITGVSEGELILKDALPFEVREIFLIHKNSGLLIAHASASELTNSIDQELIGGMLTAIKDFVTEAFNTKTKQDLNEIQYGDLKILLEMGRYSYIAAVVSGVEQRGFHIDLQKLGNRIHKRFHKMLRQFNGDTTRFGEITKLLKNFLKKYKPQKATEQKPKPYFLYFIASAIIVFLLTWGGIKLTHYLQTRKIEKIIAQKIETIPQLEEQQIEYKIANDNITISGKVASLLLIDKIDSLMHTVPGIKKVNNHLVLSLSEAEIARQIEAQIKQFKYAKPRFIIEQDQVVIEGNVPEIGIKRQIGYLTSEIPGVRVVINNLKISTPSITKTREFLRNQIIYFPANKTTPADTELTKLEAILQQFSGLDKSYKLVIKGYSDNSAATDYNLNLSRLRAESVASYFRTNGIPDEQLVVEYYGEKNPLASNEIEAGRSKNRRVEFDIKK